MGTNDIVSERQAMKMLSVSLDTLRQEVNAGRLGFMGPRNRKRFFVSELQRWQLTHKAIRKKLGDVDLAGVPRRHRIIALSAIASGLRKPPDCRRGR